jgi:hypothetical protein
VPSYAPSYPANNKARERRAMSCSSRKVGLLVVLAVCALASASTAGARPPDRGTFSVSDQGVDPAGTTCVFPVAFSQVEYGFFDAFFDKDGNFVKAIVHINYDATISANGKTLVERDTFTRTIYADGTMRDTGSTVHIQGPGGIVMRDAGQIVYSDSNETVAYVHGPHPQLFGASFCGALAP